MNGGFGNILLRRVWLLIAFCFNLRTIKLQRESPMLQPGLVKPLPETDGDAAREFRRAARCPCSVTAR